MPKLTYWIAHNLDDRPCYSVRARTRKAVREGLDKMGPPEFQKQYYSKPMKVVVEYEDALDLLIQCLGEGSINEDRYHAIADANTLTAFEEEE